MKKIGLFLLALVAVLAACKKTQQNTQTEETHKWEFDKLSIDKKLAIKGDSTKDGATLSLEFNYPSGFENDSVLKLAQNMFVINFAGDDYKNMPPKEAFDAFEKKLENELTEMGKLAVGDGVDILDYYNSVKTTVFDTTAISITAKMYAESYTGGAHGAHQTTYHTMDIRNGKILNEDILFKGGYKDQLTSLIREGLKDSKNTMGDPITILEPDSVVPNGNFYFNESGLVYVYNEYEVAPYSDGLIEAQIPYEKIKDLLSSDYQQVVDIKMKKE
jgi:Protein of unknown function (DUF3298).